MLKFYAALPPRKRIGILAIILGIIAAFIGVPNDNTTTLVNIKELSITAGDNVNSVTVQELSNWIIKGKMDYRLVDLRISAKYDEYNIPSSECVSMSSLTKSELKRNEKIILYSDDDIVASQAWFILKSDGYKSVSILKKGMEAWKSEIVFPSCNCGEHSTTELKQLHAKKAEVAKFFGGIMQADGGSNSKVKKDLPKLSAPKKVIFKTSRKKPAREGC
ncbi:MAG: rhodanese-like domain-containing protein [Melioribacteraceae bacterium]|nr:rhodanese-like domain-containing protein [Melioribacteraceae bacterium]